MSRLGRRQPAKPIIKRSQDVGSIPPAVSQQGKGRRGARTLVRRNPTPNSFSPAAPVAPPAPSIPATPKITSGRQGRRGSRLVLSRNPLYTTASTPLYPPSAFMSTSGTTLVYNSKAIRLHEMSIAGAWDNVGNRVNIAQGAGANTIRIVNWLTVNSTQITSADNGLTLTQLVTNGLLHVSATFGPAVGNIAVQTSGGIAVLSYNGKTGGFQITGIVAGTGSWTVATNNWVLEPDGTRGDNETRWQVVDSAIQYAQSVGLLVELDLSTYRDWLAKLGTNPYTFNWAPFLSYVANRTNTQKTDRPPYSSDPTISLIALAGNPRPGGELDGNGNTLTTTGSQLSDAATGFYATNLALLRSYFPYHLLTSGGLRNYKPTSLASSSEVDWKTIFADVNCNVPAVRIYSGVDFGDTINTSKDEDNFPGVATYVRNSLVKPIVVEEFGFDQATYTDSVRAAKVQAIFILALSNNASGIGVANAGTDLVNTDSRLVNQGAWSGGHGAYNQFDEVTNGGITWWSFASANSVQPVDNATGNGAWGKVRSSTLDISTLTPFTLSQFASNAPGVVTKATKPIVINPRTPRPRQPQYPIILRDYGYVPITSVVNLIETIAVSASVAKPVSLHPKAIDSLLIAAAVKPGLLVHGGPSDTVSLSDSLTLHFARQFFLGDVVQLSDAVTPQEHITGRLLVDLVIVQGAVSHRIAARKTLSAIVSVADSILTTAATQSFLSDAVLTSATLRENIALHRQLADSVVISDLTSATLTILGHTHVNITAQYDITDLVGVHITKRPVISDAVNIIASVMAQRGNFSINDRIAIAAAAAAIVHAKRHRRGKIARTNPLHIRRGSE